MNNKEEIVTSAIISVCYLIAFILGAIALFKNTPIWTCTWYDIILMLTILGQELRIRMLIKENRKR